MDNKQEKKSKFFSLLKQKQKKKENHSPLQRSASYRHIPSPSLDGTASLDDSSIHRLEVLEISVQEKDSIIDRLSIELEKAGRQIDAMGAKLNTTSEHLHSTVASEVDQLHDRLIAKEQQLTERINETKVLEHTIANMQRDITTNPNKTFDEKNAERLENENDLLSRQVKL